MNKLGPPASTPEYMYGAWAGCLHCAIGEKEVTDRFTAETGVKLPIPARNVLEKMVDEATGRDEAFATAFVTWFNENIWGEI